MSVNMHNKVTVDSSRDYQPLDAHKWYLGAEYRFEPNLTSLVSEYGDTTSEYIAGTLGFVETEASVLKLRLSNRLEGMRVFSSNIETDGNKEKGGFFDGNERVIVINSSQDSPETIQSLQHEVVHAMALAGKVHPTVLSSDARNVLNGIHSSHYDFSVGKRDKRGLSENGRWINEATIEHARSMAFGENGSETAYQIEVMTIRALMGIDPALEQALIDSVFVTPNKGGVWGSIEKLVGPLWIEEAEDILMQDLDDFPIEIIESIPNKQIQSQMANSILAQARELGLHR